MEGATLSKPPRRTIVMNHKETKRYTMNLSGRVDKSIKVLFSLASLTLVLLVLWQSARLTFRPDPRDDLRRADALFAAGRYHDAFAAYQALAAKAPRFAPVFARLGAVRLVRGEHLAADRLLAYALGLGLRDEEAELVRLYQGRVASAANLRDEASQFWERIDERSALFPLRRVLEAERLLATGDYAGAEATYRAALPMDLPPAWRVVVTARLASLRAAADPEGALADLERVQPAPRQMKLPTLEFLTAPLLPRPDPDPRQLAQALRAGRAQRPQLLGQLYLQAGMYTLAEAQFTIVAPDSSSALAAAAYAAYVRWRSGDRDEGIRRLEALVAAHPDDSRTRALLALAYLSNDDPQEAQAQLEALRAQAPRAPNTHLAWGQWYTTQHDYVAAGVEYRRALDDAMLDERGMYALELARFHTGTSLRVCEDGLPAAEEATRLLPTDARAWSTLAAAHLVCGDPAQSRAAAERALRHDPQSAEAAYYLGRALAALGDRAGARLALVNAADFAPASPWRERAEVQIVTLGL